MKNSILLLALIIIISCKNNTEKTTTSTIDLVEIDDSAFVKDSTFTKGDVRRYGIVPNQKSTSNLKNIFTLAEKGLPMVFPKGYYPIDIRIEGRKHMAITFEDAIIGGGLQIFEKDSIQSQYLTFKGSVTILDKLFTRKSNNISFETVNVSTDIENNIRQKKNRGVSIYVGSNTITFETLTIDSTGGLEDDYYQHTAAALQVHGWNNNPKALTIGTLSVTNSDRTAIYLTGNNHNIKTVVVENFGLGSPNQMFGLGDAAKGEEKQFSGLWINKCNDCVVNEVSLKNPKNKGRYSMKLDEGVSGTPTFINQLEMDSFSKQLDIYDDPLTNILIKREL